MPVATTILLITAATDLRLCYSRLERVRTSLRNSDCDAKFTGRHRTLAEYGRPLSARDEVTKWESQLNMMHIDLPALPRFADTHQARGLETRVQSHVAKGWNFIFDHSDS
ncbi:MAG: hypothetical protein L6R35_005478 [Caloplaca aegaea]|nr:MAG: hypothetical protein L6R35_005478 [Caloplaca aegaea]